MDLLTALIVGLGHAISPLGLLFLLIGSVAGIIVGATPGLGAIVLLSVLLPFLYGMPAQYGLILLLAAEGGTYFSGSIPSILLNTPGTPESAATVLDGYPMAKKGAAARALGISACATTLGGIIGFFCLFLIIPFMPLIVKAFYPSDYFMLAIMAVIMVGQLQAKTVTKGILSGIFGLMLSFIGYDPITGVQRFTFDVLSLYDGINIAALALGLFAIPEMFSLYGRNLTRRGIGTGVGFSIFSGEKGNRVIDGVRDVFTRLINVFRSSILGTFIGILPGVGGIAATFFAYGLAAKVSKFRDNFGHGEPDGVIAPEAAAMAKEGGSLIPTVALGVPGSAGMAVVLSGLTILGLVPGKELVEQHTDLIFTMAFAIAFASFTGSILGLLLAPFLAHWVRSFPPWTIVPFIFILGLLGAGAAAQDYFQMYVLVAVGIVAYVARRYGYSMASMIIGFVLGPILEKNLYLMVHVQGISSFHRPLTLLFIAVTVYMIISPIYKKIKPKKTSLSSN